MANTSNINVLQNTDEHLNQVAAASLFYGRAKLCLGIQFALTVPAAVIISVIIFFSPESKAWTTFYALTVALLDATILNAIQSHYKKLGALTQELFDTQLLSIEWNVLRAGPKPDSEDVIEAATKLKKKSKLEFLRDWYPPVVGRLPLPLSRLICQRANPWWDLSLRKKYDYVLTGILVVIVIAVFSIALAGDSTIEEMILSVYAPIAPAVLWSIREIRSQRKAIEMLGRVKKHVESVWNEVLAGKWSITDLNQESRVIQNVIFDGRTHNPMIFDWINKLVRPKHQQTMNAKAQELVNEAMKSHVLALWENVK